MASPCNASRSIPTVATMNLARAERPRARRRLLGVLTVGLVLGLSAPALAVELVITNDTTLPGGTYTYDAIRVQAGATLTLQSDAAAGLGATLKVGDLQVEAGGAIRANGKGFGQNAGSGAGPQGNYRVGGGGGGHAGYGGGGTGSYGSVGGGGTYGSALEPSGFGSGGGSYGNAAGGTGGGLITIEATGTVTIDGVISANGTNGGVDSYYYAAGGGSGGTIVVIGAAVLGTGTIQAIGGNGGMASYAQGGGGSGGRIMIRRLAAGLTVQASGGTGGSRGAAGTKLLTLTDDTLPSLILDDGGSGAALTPVPAADYALRTLIVGGAAQVRIPSTATVDVAGTFSLAGASTLTLDTTLSALDATIGAGAKLTHTAGATTFALAVDGDLGIEPGATIDASGRGHEAGAGSSPGVAGGYRIGAGGGGHGGNGGYGTGSYGSSSASGASDSLLGPSELGSGGGSYDQGKGGNGGGRLVVDVGGTLTVDGAIRADGANGGGSSYYYAGGGGSGGTVDLSAGSVSGSGTIAANGGAGANVSYAQGGGGGGGRILIEGSVAPGVALSAVGGAASGQRGGAGTILVREPGATDGALRVANSGAGASTPVGGGAYSFTSIAVDGAASVSLLVPVVAADMDVRGASTLVLDAQLSVGLLQVVQKSKLTHSAGGVGLLLEVGGDLFVEAGSAIDADAKGMGAGTGPTPGPAGGYRIGGGGGGHGGRGGSGNGNNGSVGGGASDGDPFTPTIGSGGGSCDASVGGSGGGALVVRVGGTFVLDGAITAGGASGASHQYNYASGGGSGGQVVVQAGQILGSGAIRANGGSGGVGSYARGGGGAGGRVVIDVDGPMLALTAAAGGASSSQPGGAGTVIVRGPDAAEGTLSVANGGLSGATTPIALSGAALSSIRVMDRAVAYVVSGSDISVAGLVRVGEDSTLLLDAKLSASELRVAPRALLSHTAGQGGFDLQLSGDLFIDELGRISVNGRGHGRDQGPGLGGYAEYRYGAGGGALGGRGGSGTGSYGGSAGGSEYGSITAAALMGSGGGSCTDSGPGGAGGGHLAIAAARILLDGSITADGVNGTAYSSYYGGGGGSGGSIHLSAQNLIGAGVITADGGGGASTSYSTGGGGSGGRILLDIASRDERVLVTARGGSSSATWGGAGTILTRADAETPGALLVDNGGVGASFTHMVGGPYAFADITAQAGGRVRIVDGQAVSTASLQVASGAILRLDTKLDAGSVLVESGGVIDHSSGDADLLLEVSGDVLIEPGGTIHGNSRGYGASAGTGAGVDGSYRIGGGGGAFAGNGGNSSGSYGAVAGGAPYGSLLAPVSLGSGGGDVPGSVSGGAGGGRIVIHAGGVVKVEGAVTANGANGAASSSYYAAGGGSGGTIEIAAAQLVGGGIVSANGGAGASVSYAQGGGGSGGRIRIDAPLAGPSLQVKGGTSGSQAGGAGVIHLAGDQTLIVSNSGVSGSTTPVPAGAYALRELRVEDGGRLVVDSGDFLSLWDTLTVASGGTLYLDTTLDAANTIIESGGILTPVSGGTSFHLKVDGALQVAAGGTILANGRGYGAAAGTGAGGGGSYRVGAGGGGYGCNGGAGGGYYGGAAGGLPYGSATDPRALGSGGGNSCNSMSGGAGGGALLLTVGGTTTLDGSITSNGYNGGGSGNDCASAGGSGGSVLLRTGRLEGGGLLTARGGNGPQQYYAQAGGGAGGRIVVSASDNAFAGVVGAEGGTGKQAGCDGTVILGQSVSGITDLEALPGASDGALALTFTEPADIDPVLHSYEIRTSEEPLTEATFPQAAPVASGAPAPVGPGTVLTHEVTGLVPGRTYWVAVRVVDDAGNHSVLSNIATAQATGDAVAPDPVVDLAAAPGGAEGQVALTWTAPFDTGLGASTYELRYQTAGAFDWDTATPVSEAAPSAGSPGDPQSMLVTLPSGQTWALALRVTDLTGNASGDSNVATADLVPPSVAIAAPAAGSGVSGTVLVRAAASDDVAIDRVRFTLDGDLQQEFTTPTAGEYTWSLDTRAIGGGAHTLGAEAIDTFGNTATASVSVDVSYDPPAAPVILAPVAGLRTTVATHDVVGTVEPGTTVSLAVNGAALQTTAAAGGLGPLRVEAESPANDRGACVVDASGASVRLPDAGALENVALGKPVVATSAYSSSYDPANVVDGLIDDGKVQKGYWLTPNGVTTAELTVDLGALHEIEQIRVINTSNGPYADRSTAAFRIGVAADDGVFTIVESGTLTEDDITHWHDVSFGSPLTVRWVRFYMDGIAGGGGGLAELVVYGRSQSLSCAIESPWLTLGGPLVRVDADGDPGGGTITTEVSAGQPLFADDFEAPEIDEQRWVVSPGVAQNGALGGPGVGSWGSRFAFTIKQFQREIGAVYEARFTVNARAMVGLRRAGAGTSYTDLGFALYFDNGNLRVYEDGNHRADVGTYTQGSTWELSFTPGTLSGVAIRGRVVGAASWKLLYESTYAGGDTWNFGYTIYDGQLSMDDVAVRADVWLAAGEAASLGAGPLKVRALLQKQDPSATSPVLDAIIARYASDEAHEGDATFRFEGVTLPEGDVVLVATASDSTGASSAASAPVDVHVDSVPPAAIADLAIAKGEAQGTLDLTWTAVGDDGAVGTATAYEVRWATVPFDGANWALAKIVGEGVPTPAPAGTTESMQLTGLVAGQLTYVGVKAIDDMDSRSPLSNVVSENASDRTAPALTFDSPADGTHHRQSVTVTASSTDNVAVTAVSLLVDGQAVATDATSPYQLVWDTTAFADGAHQVAVLAVDADENTTIIERTLVADNTPPTIGVEPVTTPTADSPTLVYTIADNLTPTEALVIKDAQGAGPPFLIGAEGVHDVTLTVTDLAGNTASGSVSFTLDHSAPAPVADLVATSAVDDPTTIELTWTAPADSLTEVSEYEVRYATELFDMQSDGSDGALVVTTDLVLDPARTTLTAAVDGGATSLPVSSSASFAVGQEIVLYVAQCDPGVADLTGVTTWGQGSPRHVAGVSTGVITIDSPLNAAVDGVACTVVVQEVPQYTEVQVLSGGALKAPAWDGTTGGLLAFRVAGSVYVAPGGRIDVTGAGYRGSGRQCVKNVHGLQGESYTRQAPDRSNDNAWSGGAGGTGNAPGVPGWDCAGGGGGGHATAGANGADYNSRPGGQPGDPVGDPALTHIYFGGAGGQGGADEDGGSPGGGGNGGGLLLVAAGSILNEGTITADGATASGGCNGCGCGGGGCGMGGGGGGAGGTVHLSAEVIDIGAGVTTASGGAGGPNNGCGGAGGVGAAGRIRIDGVNVVGASAPSAHSGSMTRFDWATATPITEGIPAPAPAGTEQTMTASGFDPSATVYFAIRSRNVVGLQSLDSNVAPRDVVPPSIAIVAPEDGATIERPVLVVAEGSDDVSIESVELYVDGELRTADGSAPYEMPWDMRLEQPGSHSLEVVATDFGGNTTSDAITVTVDGKAPAAPVITYPGDGDILASALTDVVGTAEAGTSVSLTVDGALQGTTPVLAAASVAYEAEAPQNRLLGCEATPDGAGVRISDTPLDGATDLAAASLGSAVYGSSNPQSANDGSTSTCCYWSVGAEQNEKLFYLGRVALEESTILGEVRLLLWNGDGRSYYNYKVTVSEDGKTFSTWVDTTGSELDYQAWQSLVAEPRPVRYIDVWLSGNTVNTGAHIIEIQAFASTAATMCIVETPFVPAPQTTLLTAFQAFGEAIDGATHAVQAGAWVIAEGFEGAAVDTTDWWSARATVTNGVVSVDGTSSWGSGRVFSNTTLSRSTTESVVYRVRKDGSGATMFGLLRLGKDPNYTKLGHAIYLSDSNIYIYEDGSSRGYVGAISYGTWYDLRISPTPTGATYAIRAVGAATWTGLYSSSYRGADEWEAGFTVHSGKVYVDSILSSGESWMPPDVIAKSRESIEAVRFRTVLSRASAADASPVLDGWSVLAGTAQDAAVGPGVFRFEDVTLTEGTNVLAAAAGDSLGTSLPSAPVTVVVDTGPPDAIADLTASSLTAGVIFLEWSPPANETPASYSVYRSEAAFTDVTGLTPLAEGVATLSYGDKPPADGQYHYAVTSTDAAGNESASSNVVLASADTETPHASIALSPGSPIGVGVVDVTLTTGEPLQAAPTLTVELPQGAGVESVQLTGDGSLFIGQLVVDASWPSGTATFSYEGVDASGNLGTTIDSGATFVVDTAGPVATIATDPASPVGAGDVWVTVQLDQPAIDMALALVPESGAAIPIALNAADRVLADGTVWTGDVHYGPDLLLYTGATHTGSSQLLTEGSSGANARWKGTFGVSTSTGDGLATFALEATDEVGNLGTTIAAGGELLIDTAAPGAPVLTATKQPAGWFLMEWTTPAGAPVTYRLYRSTAAFSSQAEADLVSEGAGTTAQEQPPYAGEWTYAVAAIDAAGNEGPLSNLALVVSEPPPPEDVTGLTVVGAGKTTLTVAFTPSVNSSGLLAGYRAYLNGAMIATLPPTATGYTWQNLSQASKYALKISAFDANSKESIGTAATGYTLLPNPIGVSGTGHDERVVVSWSAVGPAENLKHYAVYLETSAFASVAGLSPVAINPTGTTVTLGGLDNGTTYWLAVTAVNKSGAQDAAVTPVVAVPGDNEAPEAPKTLVQLDATATTVSLLWTASANTAFDLVGYTLSVDGQVKATLGPDATTYAVTGLATGSAYTVGVSAFDGSGNESPKTTLVSHTLMPNPSGVAVTSHDKSLEVVWTPPAPLANVDSYAIYVLPASFTDVTGLTAKLKVGASAQKATVTGLTNGTTWYVAVTTITKGGFETKTVAPASGMPADDAPPEPPTGVSITQSGEQSLSVAWVASANSSGDLASYRVYRDGAKVETTSSTAATLTGLAKAKSYVIGVTAVDAGGNESAPTQLTGYTWMPHPVVQVSDVKHQKLVVTWTPAQPTANLSHYAVYASAVPFTSTTGMTPKQTVSSSGTTATVTGLTNGQPAFIAVSSINKSQGQDPSVTPISGTPEADTAGPSLSDVRFAGQPLPDGGLVAVDGAVSVAASDPEGVGHVQFMVDDLLLGVDQTAADGWTAQLLVDKLTDGVHTLHISAFDTLSNKSTLDVPIAVSIAPPAAPTITSPKTGYATKDEKLLVNGSGKASTTVKVYINDTEAGSTTVDPAGHFGLLVTLSPGTNVLQASLVNTGGEGARSASVTVIYDDVTPAAPKSLTATAKEAGQVKLAWYGTGVGSLSGIAGYRIYRAPVPFDSIDGATLLNPGSLAPSLGFTDLPPGDGAWTYRVTVVTKAGAESGPSNPAEVTSDSTPPAATSVVYAPKGPHDGDRFGVGPVDVSVTFSEALSSAPFFSITTDGGLPIHVGLTKASGNIWSGSFDITETTASGVAYAVVSARDLVNNRGTAIESGGTFVIDTDAPNVESLTIAPVTPIKNDPSAPVTVQVTVVLNEPLPDYEVPQFEYTLSTSHAEPTAVALAKTGELAWTGGFILPAEAGAVVEALSFTYLGLDELGNESTTIVGPSSFEVYQGELPALEAPLGLSARSLPGGEVELTWSEVAGAAEYQIIRKGQGETAFTESGRATETTYVEDPGADGTWQYEVASVRQHNGQESASEPSPAVTVISDRTAPGAPQAMTLELVGNGIKVEWQPPLGLNEPITFRIYRAAADSITSVEGLEPLAANIDQLLAVDPYPSKSEHAYVVVAEDVAGNLSEPSNSTYLNVNLLPVSSLAIDHLVGQAPVLSWTHAAKDLAGYRIAADGADPVGSLVGGTSWVDTAFAEAARTYGVRAVDSFGFESVERALTLPIVTVALPDPTMARGVIGTLHFDVTSGADLTGARLLVNFGGVSHTSSPVSLPAGSTVQVPVVVGGYPSLADQTTAQLTVRLEPNVGEKIDIRSTTTLEVGDDVYTVDVQNEKLTRGGTGNVRLVFHNTGEQEVELLTALSSGSKPSTEVRFTLLDADGNQLSSAPLKQAVGDQVLTLPNKQTVARVAAQESFTSAWVALPVPASAPDDVVLRITVDSVHYALGKPEHVQVPGVSSSRDASLVNPPYDPKVTSVTPESSYGAEPIVIAGQAVATDTGEPVADVPVKLVVEVSGFERTYDLYTDANGDFEYTFVPLANEGGSYSVWANHPIVTDKAVEATFSIHRVWFSPSSASLTLATNYGHTVPVKVTTNAGTTLANVRIEAATVVPAGITLTLPAPKTAGSGTSTSLPVTITGDNNAPKNGQITLRILSDEGVWGTVPVSWVLTEAKPSLAVSPPGLETGVARGDTTSELLTLTNKGLAKFADMELSLLNSTRTAPAPGWAFLASETDYDELPVGQSLQVTLVFSPSAQVALSLTEPYVFYVRVLAQNQLVTDIPIYVWVDDTGLGSHLFKVSDIYTGSFDASGALVQGVKGAKVEVDKQFGSAYTKTLTTDTAGEAMFVDLPTGTYKYRVSATGHDATGGNFVVKPGVTGTNEVFLSSQLVTIEWEVNETTIEDKYEIVLHATFETDVPAAVVVAEPPSVALPAMSQGDVFLGEYTLTNYGLIKAQAMKVTWPTNHADYKFELLVTPPEEIAAKQSVTVPYRITRISSSEPDGSASGGGCSASGMSVNHCYGYVCQNGQWTTACTPMAASGGGGCSGGKNYFTGFGGGGGYSGGYGGGGGGGGYSSASTGSPVPGSPGCDPCEHPSLSAAEKECCKQNKSQKTGSAVDLVTGRYEDEATDMEVAVLGQDLALERYYYGDRWHLRFFETDLQLVQNGDTLQSILHMGVSYSPAEVSGTVFKAGSNLIHVLEDGSMRWEDLRGSWRGFDATGRLMAFGDRNERQVKLLRDGAGRIVGLADTFDTQVVWYEYDSAGKPSAIEDLAGRRVTWTWSGDNLVTVTDVLGETTTYTYDAQGRMTGKSFPNGKKRIVSYASNGVIASVLDENGQGMYFDYGYNETTQLNYAATIYTDGTVMEKWFDKSGAVVQETVDGAEVVKPAPVGQPLISQDGELVGAVGPDGEQLYSFAYGAFGQITEQTDGRGIHHTYTYDDHGNLTEQVTGAGRPDAITTRYEYDAYGNLVKETHVGATEAEDLVLSYTYDDAGNPLTITDAGGHVTSYTYDGMRDVLTVTGPMGEVTTNTYDVAGRLVEKTLLEPGASEAAVVQHFDYGSALDGAGKVIGTSVTATDAAGRAVLLTYDTNERLSSMTDNWGRTTEIEYDARGRVVRQSNPDGSELTVVREVVDGGISRETRALDGEVLRVVETDAQGRAVREIEDGIETAYVYDGVSDKPAQILRPGVSELYTYDVFGNPVSRVYLLDDGQSFTELMEYDGTELVHFTNDHGVGYDLELNAAGDTTKRTYGQGRVEQYAYDAHGRLVGVNDANGNPVLEIAYDTAGEIRSRTFATGATVEYSRDARGDVTEATSSAGIRFAQAFDVYGNVTNTEVYGPDAPDTPEQTITSTYDAYQRLVTTANETVSMTANYDDFERTRSMTVDFGAFTKSYTYELDERGRRLAFIGPDGERTDYSYAVSGRLTGVTDAQGNAISIARSGTYGEEVTLPGGITSVKSRDALERVTRVLAVTPGGETLMDQQYTWDAHRLTATSTEQGAYDYAYDDTGRVVAASYPTVEQTSITLDPSGNRIADDAFGAATPVYNSANQLISFGSAASYTYDAEGNMVTRTEGGVTTSYDYNAANQLVRVLDGSGAEIASYAYDPLGRRVKKVVGGQVTWFLYAEEGLIGEYDAQGTAISTYGWRPGTEWQSAPLWMRVGTQVYYYLTDRVGTPQKLVDVDGQVVWSVETEAYGAGHVAPGSIVTNNIRFSSQYYDEETGLHYNLFRYYDPRLGRYLNVEPLLEMSNRTNFYEFADNNPLLRADRMGLATGSATTDGGGVTIGGGVKLGGIGLSGSVSVGREDCCSGGKMIRGGKICVTVKVAASAGGVGGEGFGGKAELALVEVEGAGSCKRCSGCGGGPPSGDCCITVTVTVGKVDLKIGIFKAEFSIFSVSYQMCWSGAGGPGFSGPGASGGFGFGGGGGGGK